ncbi:MAG: DNA N-6-adenine-methyltransferase [Pseudomonadota bacterium]
MDAYAKSKTPKEERDRRATPRWAYAAICAGIGLRPVWDVAAERHTAVTPGRCWTREDDSLSLSWAKTLRRKLRTSGLIVVWMNPPYSDPLTWCAKAAEEAAQGLIVVGLLPDDRSTNWYRQQVHGVAPSVFLTPERLPFLMPSTGREQRGNPKGSIIPIWTPWRTGHTSETVIDLDTWNQYRPRPLRAAA